MAKRKDEEVVVDEVQTDEVQADAPVEEEPMAMTAEEPVPMAPTPTEAMGEPSVAELLIVVKHLVSRLGADSERELKEMFPILR